MNTITSLVSWVELDCQLTKLIKEFDLPGPLTKRQLKALIIGQQLTRSAPYFTILQLNTVLNGDQANTGRLIIQLVRLKLLKVVLPVRPLTHRQSAYNLTWRAPEIILKLAANLDVKES